MELNVIIQYFPGGGGGRNYNLLGLSGTWAEQIGGIIVIADEITHKFCNGILQTANQWVISSAKIEKIKFHLVIFFSHPLLTLLVPGGLDFF